MIVTQQDSEKITQLSDRLAISLKMIGYGPGRIQRLSYFLECLSGGDHSGGEGILIDIKDIIEARLHRGAW